MSQNCAIKKREAYWRIHDWSSKKSVGQKKKIRNQIGLGITVDVKYKNVFSNMSLST